MVGVVEMTPADRALLHLSAGWDREQRDRSSHGGDGTDLHRFLPCKPFFRLEARLLETNHRINSVSKYKNNFI